MTVDMEHVETVIIGGGHAGLTQSYFLSQLGQEHVILERGRVGERWRSERWDSFHFQFPNWTIELPGYKYQCDNPDAFAPGHEVGDFSMATLISSRLRCVVELLSCPWSKALAKGDI
jgi:putative flavoprotein involved in K+ transport